MKYFTPALIVLFISTSWAIPTLDPNKRTVCAMTLNSDEEREIFRQEIEKDRTNYNPLVELTDFGEADWFQKACKSGIRCDQVLISGHFTDRFSGINEGVKRNLKLDDMERMGCQNTCEGILDHPYEVFLLGCNTLATKAPDNRTPEAYLGHLLEDGVPASRAQLITEARYGRTGDDNKSRIERAFRGQKKMLYGFTARGPSGATIDRMLRDYFQKTPLRKSLNRAQAMRTLGHIESMNTQLAQSLNMTAFDQCVAGDDGEKDRRICALRNANLSIDKRLSVIEDALTADDWIKYIPTINNFFRQNPPDLMTTSQKQMLASIAGNQVIGRQAKNLARTSTLPAVKVEWEFFMASVGFTLVKRSISIDPIGEIIEQKLSPKPSGRIGPDFLEGLPRESR
jgi:hypothetical protein